MQPDPVPADAGKRIHQILTREEIARLTTASDARGLLSLLFTYGLIAVSLAFPALWPHPVTVSDANTRASTRRARQSVPALLRNAR